MPLTKYDHLPQNKSAGSAETTKEEVSTSNSSSCTVAVMCAESAINGAD